MKVVTVNGCFDVLHVGHVRMLQAAKEQGDSLVVLLNSDSSVRKFKGKGRPINSQKDRKEMLEALNCVDQVIVFSDETPNELLEILKPAVHVKGGRCVQKRVDKEKEIVEKYGGKIVFLPEMGHYSTSRIIGKMGKP